MGTISKTTGKEKRKYVYSGKYSKKKLERSSQISVSIQQPDEVKYYPIGEFFRTYKNEFSKWKIEFVFDGKWYSASGEYEDFYDALIGITRVATSIQM